MRRKYAILVGDGMGDHPVPELGNKTPLEVAKTPYMDRVAQQGILGLVRTLPEGMHPGSDVANLSIMGYDPRRYYQGRGPLEAASMDIKLGLKDLAFRCNLVTVEDGIMLDYSGGRISSWEAKELVTSLQGELGGEEFDFYPGVSYRELLIWHRGPEGISTTPPHDITGQGVDHYLPSGPGSQTLRELMAIAGALLQDHPVNRRRKEQGEPPANAIWPWGQGRKPSMPTLWKRFSLTGVVISAVDLIRGMGRLAGLEPVAVPGATGYLDTNYRGKVEAGLQALRSGDFLYLHVEAPDEVSHEGNWRKKVQAIEDFDQQVVGPILEGLVSFEEWALLVLTDHLTPLSLRTHAHGLVPFALLRSSWARNPISSRAFCEAEAKETGLIVLEGHRLIETLIKEGPLS